MQELPRPWTLRKRGHERRNFPLNKLRMKISTWRLSLPHMALSHMRNILKFGETSAFKLTYIGVRRQLSVSNCQCSQLSVRTTVSADNCQWRQLSVGTTVSGPTVSGNCKCFPGTETTVRSYSFRADNCKILQFWSGQLSDLSFLNNWYVNRLVRQLSSIYP